MIKQWREMESQKVLGIPSVFESIKKTRFPFFCKPIHAIYSGLVWNSLWKYRTGTIRKTCRRFKTELGNKVCTCLIATAFLDRALS